MSPRKEPANRVEMDSVEREFGGCRQGCGELVCGTREAWVYGKVSVDADTSAKRAVLTS